MQLPHLLSQVFGGQFSLLLQMLGVRLDKTWQIPASVKEAPSFIVLLGLEKGFYCCQEEWGLATNVLLFLQ